MRIYHLSRSLSLVQLILQDAIAMTLHQHHLDDYELLGSVRTLFKRNAACTKLILNSKCFCPQRRLTTDLHGRDVLELLVIGNLAAKVGELFMSWKICSQEKKSNIPIVLCFVGL